MARRHLSVHWDDPLGGRCLCCEDEARRCGCCSTVFRCCRHCLRGTPTNRAVRPSEVAAVARFLLFLLAILSPLSLLLTLVYIVLR
jgi:hypothetical protein